MGFGAPTRVQTGADYTYKHPRDPRTFRTHYPYYPYL